MVEYVDDRNHFFQKIDICFDNRTSLIIKVTF